MSVFWKKALSIMEKKGIKQASLARNLNKAQTSVHNWVSRDTIPQADDAVKIADLLGVTVRYLVTGEDEHQLTPQEKRLLDLCKELPSEKMEAVITVAKTLKRDIDRERGDVSPGSSASEAV